MAPIYSYVVSAYKYDTETSYTFGPLFGVSALEKFLADLEATGDYNEPDVRVLNPPSALGTVNLTSLY